MDLDAVYLDTTICHRNAAHIPTRVSVPVHVVRMWSKLVYSSLKEESRDVVLSLMDEYVSDCSNRVVAGLHM